MDEVERFQPEVALMEVDFFQLVRFCIGCTDDTLASTANRKHWGLSSTNDCCLCGVEPCTIAHILSGCRVSLGQGRYKYRHDGLLSIISHHIAAFINNRAKVESVSETVIHFVASGARVRRQRKPSELSGLLFWAQDWIFLGDL